MCHRINKKFPLDDFLNGVEIKFNGMRNKKASVAKKIRKL